MTMSEVTIKKALVIDDSAEYRKLLLKFFKKACPSVEIDEYNPAFGRPTDTFPWSQYELLILDYDLGSGENGLEWLRTYKTSNDFPPTIILTAQDGEELVVNAQRFGAQGFLRKVGLTHKGLIESINKALDKFKEESEQVSSQNLRVHNYNKEQFYKSLGQANKNDAIYLIEIDKFHALQESLGIFASDNFALFVSESISNFVTDNDHNGSIARIGNSTIAIFIQNNKDKESCEDTAKKLCDLFNNLEYKVADKKMDFCVNIGVVFIEVGEIDVNNILMKTEAACRISRDDKSNSYVIKTDAVSAEPEVDEQEQQKITSAIKEDRIKTLFQVLVLISDSTLTVGKELYQARSSLIDEDNNIIEAKDFLPIIQNTKLENTLDRWIIRYCISELAQLDTKNKGKFAVFIKLSAQSIHDMNLTDWVLKLIQYVKIPTLGSSLIFEIGAEDFMEFQQEAKLQINKLRVKIGSMIALADVEGSSVLERCLNQEKFDFVMFSPEYGKSGKMEQKQVDELLRIAKGHEAMTVAIKIGSGDSLALCAIAGADYVMGYFVQPPMENIVGSEEVEV
jgi:EAL domain-containing protein (putative c-di-GMP-specific phosphodiesterase class I)/DNA-binding response OmpR family regulator